MKKLTLLLGTALALMCGSALADTRTSSFNSSATVARSCKIVSAPAVAFGQYDATSTHSTTPLDAQTEITVLCTKGINGAGVYIGDGLYRTAGSPDNNPDRRMRSGTSNYLRYQAFTDENRSFIWTNNTHGSNAFWSATSTDSLTPISKTAYLRVAAGQSVPTGNYADSLNVIIVF